jgi:hypothetical protein
MIKPSTTTTSTADPAVLDDSGSIAQHAATAPMLKSTAYEGNLGSHCTLKSHYGSRKLDSAQKPTPETAKFVLFMIPDQARCGIIL